MARYKITYGNNKKEYTSSLSNVDVQNKTFKPFNGKAEHLIKAELVNEKWNNWADSAGITLTAILGIIFFLLCFSWCSSVTEPKTIEAGLGILFSFCIMPATAIAFVGINKLLENPRLLSNAEIFMIQKQKDSHSISYKKLSQNDKLQNYISKETNKINANNSFSLSKEDERAISELAKMNVLNNHDYMKDVFSATDQELEEIYNNLEIKEQKKIANHSTFEGRINSTYKKNLKNILGFTCSACGKNMETIYGSIGKNYIELHHLIPYSEMQPNDSRTLSTQDFCVLCPDCHRMIHKLDNANDIDLLKRMIKLNQPKI